ncbi:MAG: multidrug resistance protein [Anaerolinea sp.]|jgi:multidrug transporter EmrE-like cation transporter|nr:multidrug resistance protein [Anaerolinea sp.]HRI56477.1 multidrug resistance protein [Anaerolineae bacterium]
MDSNLTSALLLILLSTVFGVAGQTALKMGVSQPGVAENANGALAIIGLIFKSPLMMLGLVFYAAGALAWIAVLARLDLSVAYPFLALNFVLVTLSGRFLLGETVPPLRWLGILVIIAGILLVAKSTGGPSQ